MKALIAEDEVTLAGNIKLALEHEEFERQRFQVVDVVSNGAAAIELLNNDYDFLILDLKMPEMDGTQVIEALQQLDPSKRPVVILITAFLDAYETARLAVKMGVQALLKKPFELPDLVNEIRDLVKLQHRLSILMRHKSQAQLDWTMAFSEEGTAFIQTRGLLNFTDSCSLPALRWEEWSGASQADLVAELILAPERLRSYWIKQAKATGAEMFKTLFTGTVEKSYVAAGSIVVPNTHNVRLAFVGPRRYLKLPLELLNDREEFLVLQHPLSRKVSGIKSRGAFNLPGLVEEMTAKRQKIRILLIASNTNPPIQAVDEEVAEIHDWLTTHLPANRYAIEYIPTDKATCDEILSRLSECRYNMLHYAGHGHNEKGAPGNSSLYFWEKPNRRGSMCPLSVDTLVTTLRRKGHDLRFVYLSCCYGTATADDSTLLSDDFLGVADGLVVAGVPSILGFRWAITDRGAREMSKAFYQSLCEQGEPDVALFHARCHAAGSNQGKKNGDWLAPILISQG